MKIWNLIRCEFIKNFSIKRYFLITVILIVSCFVYLMINDYTKGWHEQPTEAVTLKEVNESLAEIKKINQEKNTLLTSSLEEITINMKSIYELQKDEIEKQNSWQSNSFSSYRWYYTMVVVLKQMINQNNSKYFDNLIKQIELEDQEVHYGSSRNYQQELLNILESYYKNSVKKYYNYSMEELKTELIKQEEACNYLKEALEKNEYYISLKIIEEHPAIYGEMSKEELDKLYEKDSIRYKNYQLLIENKVHDYDDYRNLNVLEYNSIFKDEYIENEYIENEYEKSEFADSTIYTNYLEKLNERNQEKVLILRHAILNNLKHDLDFEDTDGLDSSITYTSTKNAINQVLSMSPVILFLVIITSSGIMAKEHDDGTIKQLLTKPVKRWKILFSKFLYLILYTYVVWFMAFLIMLIIAGTLYGFNDLFTPKLIIENNSVKEVNYFIWFFKELLLAGIPISSFLSLIFLLSTLTLNTAVTASINSILTIVSTFIFLVIRGLHLNSFSQLANTFLPYLNFYQVRIKTVSYLYTSSFTKTNEMKAVFICLITTLLLYVITNFIYLRKNIKN